LELHYLFVVLLLTWDLFYKTAFALLDIAFDTYTTVIDYLTSYVLVMPVFKILNK